MNSIYRAIQLCMLLAGIAFTGCKKDSFQYDILQGGEIKVDSVGFHTGSPTLKADGKSALDFIIQVYSKRKVTINGVERDSMVLIPDDRIAESEKKVFDNNDKEVGFTFSTTSATPGNLSFYAKVGGVKSATQTVSVRTPGAEFTKLIIPVVFHVFELNAGDPKRYDWYEDMPYSKLENLIKGLNAVFNRVGTHAPNGSSANIEFVLAPTYPNGTKLEKPGYNKFGYASTFAWGFGAANTNTLIKNNAASLIWNPKKYLNLWVTPSVLFFGAISPGAPKYTLSNDILEGGNLQYLAAAGDMPALDPDKIGLILGRAEFENPTQSPPAVMAYRFGTFYGLKRTYLTYLEAGYTDYCNDTPEFATTQASRFYKLSADGFVFRAENIMDVDNQNGNNVSRVNTITEEQVKRIRYVLANCPDRMIEQ